MLTWFVEKYEVAFKKHIYKIIFSGYNYNNEQTKRLIMATHVIYKPDYRIELINTAKSKNVDCFEFLKKLHQFLYYEKEISVVKNWNYQNITALMDEKELKSESNQNLKLPFYVNFLRYSNETTRFFSIKIRDINKVSDFLRHFNLSTKQIVLASWIYSQKSVLLTFYADRDLNDIWFKSLGNTFHLLNCYGITVYGGEVSASSSVSIPSHVCDRHLNPDTFEETTDITLVLEHAYAALSNPVTIEYFQESLKEQYTTANCEIKRFDETFKKIEAIKLHAEDYVFIDELSLKCQDPASIYGKQLEREEWVVLVKTMMTYLFKKIHYVKSPHLDENSEIRIPISLKEFYNYRFYRKKFGLLNTKTLLELIVKTLVNHQVIDKWDSEKEELIISPRTKFEETDDSDNSDDFFVF